MQLFQILSGADLYPVTDPPGDSFPRVPWLSSDEPANKKTFSHFKLTVHCYHTGPSPPIKCAGGDKGALGSFASFHPLTDSRSTETSLPACHFAHKLKADLCSPKVFLSFSKNKPWYLCPRSFLRTERKTKNKQTSGNFQELNYSPDLGAGNKIPKWIRTLGPFII